MTWTVLAYKPDSTDYCMGCNMGSYSSAFCWESFDDVAAAKEYVTNIIANNAFMSTNEDGYGLAILLDGKLLSGQAEFLAEATELAKPIIAERTAANAEQKRKDEAAAKRAETQRERAEFARLQEKFGGSK